MGLRDLAKRALNRALSGGAAPSSPPPARPEPTDTRHAPEAGRAAGPAVVPPQDHQTDRADKPWFMAGGDDLDGWDETNPGAEPGKKNLRP